MAAVEGIADIAVQLFLFRLDGAWRSIRLFQERDVGLTCNTEGREMRADGVGDIGRCEVGVVFFGHPRVGVAELRGNDT